MLAIVQELQSHMSSLTLSWLASQSLQKVLLGSVA